MTNPVNHRDRQAPEFTENLSAVPAIEKIREIAEGAHVCLFGTMSKRAMLEVRPMAVQAVDDAGCVWFLSGRSSNKNRQIALEARVQLLFCNIGKNQYLSLRGLARISDERALREKYWSALARTWFPGGVDDPELTVIQVKVESGDYWDTKHGKTISMLNIVLGAVTGVTQDDAVAGTVRP